MSPHLSRPPLVAAAVLVASLGAPIIVHAQTLSLGQARAQALASSPALVAAKAAVSAAEGRARQAGFAPNPEASLESENLAGTGPMKGFDGAETTLSIGQRFELGGKRRARASTAAAEVEVARLKLAVATADLSSEVLVRYAQTQAAAERVGQARRAAERAKTLADVAATLVDAGREPPLRGLRAAAEADAAQARVLAAEAELAAGRRALASLWGAGGEAAPDPVWLDLAPPGPIDPTATLDVRLAAAELEASRAQVEHERAKAVPDVTVQAGVRRFEETGDSALVVGVSAPIPIRDRNQGSIAAARSDAVAAEARQQAALLASVRVIADGQAALAAATRRQAVLETRTVPQASQALDLARQGFEAGKFGLLDVLDAQNALSDAQNDLIEARLARVQAQAALERAAAR